MQKDRLKYRANLSVVLKITDKSNLAAAETSIDAWRELRIPVDTKIADKEKYWNDMVYKLFDEFNRRMEQNINEYLNMYVKIITASKNIKIKYPKIIVQQSAPKGRLFYIIYQNFPAPNMLPKFRNRFICDNLKLI